MSHETDDEAQRVWRQLKGSQKAAIRNQLIKRDGYWCHWCGDYLLSSREINDQSGLLHRAEIDHIIPLSMCSKADILALSNMYLTCRRCNQDRLYALLIKRLELKEMDDSIKETPGITRVYGAFNLLKRLITGHVSGLEKGSYFKNDAKKSKTN